MYSDSEYLYRPGLFLNREMLFCSWIKDRTLGRSTCWIRWPWKSFLGKDVAFNGVDISSSIEKPIINTFPILFELGGGNSWVIWCYKTLIVLTKKPTTFYLETFGQKNVVFPGAYISTRNTTQFYLVLFCFTFFLLPWLHFWWLFEQCF